MEKIYSQVQKEFEVDAADERQATSRKTRQQQGTKRNLSEAQIRMLNTGEDIYEAIESSPDPNSIESALTNFQIEV